MAHGHFSDVFKTPWTQLRAPFSSRVTSSSNVWKIYAVAQPQCHAARSASRSWAPSPTHLAFEFATFKAREEARRSNASDTVPMIHFQEAREHQAEAQRRLLPLRKRRRARELAEDGAGVDLHETTSFK